MSLYACSSLSVHPASCRLPNLRQEMVSRRNQPRNRNTQLAPATRVQKLLATSGDVAAKLESKALIIHHVRLHSLSVALSTNYMALSRRVNSSYMCVSLSSRVFVDPIVFVCLSLFVPGEESGTFGSRARMCVVSGVV